MIKFFRLIRKELIETGKTGKYFKYAIGEIVLVVIGILIALQINNWNEDRKDSIKEKQIVKSLYTEFLENYDYVEDRIQYLSSITGRSNKRLLMLCNQSFEDISNDSLLSLLYNTFLSIPNYAPKVSTFKRIINNEEFNFIQKDSLKILLNQYQPIIDFTNHTNNLLQVFEQDFWTYSQNKFGGITLGKRSDLPLHKQLFEGITPPEAQFKSEDILSDITFQNILTNHSLYFGHTINRLNELQKQNEVIRDYIDRNYRF